MTTHKNIKDVRQSIHHIYTAFSLVALLIYATFFLFLGYPIQALIQGIFVVPFSISLYLSGHQKRTIAILLSLLSSISIVLLQTFLFFGHTPGFQFQLFALILVIFLINDLRNIHQKYLAFILASVSALSLLLIEFFATSPLWPLPMSASTGWLLRLSALGVTLASMILLLYSYAIHLAKKDEVLGYLACHDSLTNLHNRGHFNLLGDQLFQETTEANAPLWAILLDIDDFKLINDTYGHAGGDIALISLANRISSLLPKKAIFSRYGGEEFALLIPELEKETVIELAEKIRINVESMSIFYENHIFDITISMGLCPMESTHFSLTDLIVAADQKLYKAKHLGKNQIQY